MKKLLTFLICAFLAVSAYGQYPQLEELEDGATFGEQRTKINATVELVNQITDTLVIIRIEVDGKLDIVDTVDMLAPYVKGTDMPAFLDPYLQVTDTAAMLEAYFQTKDTLDMLKPYVLKTDIDGVYLVADDTTAMLAPYFSNADANIMQGEVDFNTAKVSNVTHTGEVTGGGSLVIADNVIEGVNFESTNSPFDGNVPMFDLVTGGFTWANNSAVDNVARDMFKDSTYTVNSMLLHKGDLTVDHFYLRSNGNDLLSGTDPNNAWRTLDKLQVEIDSGTVGNNDIIHLESGSMFVGGIDLGSLDNVTIETFGGVENATITGLYNVSGGWFDKGSNIYSKAVDADDVKYLFVDDVSFLIGRYPNIDTDTADAGGTTTTVVGTDSLTQADDYWNGGETVCRLNDYWYDIAEITDYDQGTKTLTVSPALSYAVPAGNGYFIQNHENCLDLVGEWAFDGDSVYLYWSSDVNDLNIEASVYENAIEFTGEDISIKSINIKGYNGAGIYTSSSASRDKLDVYYNSITHVVNGIFMDTLHNANFYYNSFEDIGNNCFEIYDCDTADIFYNTFNRIGLNPIYGDRGSHAIRTINCDTMRVFYNDIDSVGYIGVMTSRGNGSHVYGNRIKNVCMVTFDGGAIYAYITDDANTPNDYNGQLWENNFVENIKDTVRGLEGTAGLASYSYGLYADGGSSEITMKKNLVVGFRNNFYTNFGDDLVIDSCWFTKAWAVYGSGSGGYRGIEVATEWASGDTTQNFTFTNNYIITNWEQVMYNMVFPYSLKVANIGTQVDIDGNYILKATGSQTIGQNYSTHIAYFNNDLKNITTWNALDGVGTDVEGTAIWESGYTNTPKLDHVVYDYNFTNRYRTFEMESGWTYYEVDGTETSSYLLAPFTGAILLRINDLDLP